MRFTQTDAGTVEIAFHQSWLNEYMLCPERARRSLTVRSPDTDATILGTSLHAGIECRLKGGTVDEAWDHAEATLAAAVEDPDVYWVQELTSKGEPNPKGLFTMLSVMLNMFERDTLPTLGEIVAVEQELSMELPAVTELIGRRVVIRGTVDIVEKRRDGGALRIRDPKSSGRPYVQWERQRWALQPTFYVPLVEYHYGERPDFVYDVYLKRKSPANRDGEIFRAQEVNVTRDESHFSWLQEQIRRVLVLSEKMGADSDWPTNDHHALCSKKWCTFWDSCKGALVAS